MLLTNATSSRISSEVTLPSPPTPNIVSESGPSKPKTLSPFQKKPLAFKEGVEELKKDLENLVQKAQETGKSNISYNWERKSQVDSGEKLAKSLKIEDAQCGYTPRHEKPKARQKIEKMSPREKKLSALVQQFQSIGADENKQIKKISSEITRLYRSINKMASKAREQYGLDLAVLEPKPLNPGFPPFPKPQLALLEGSFNQSPLKRNSNKSKERPEYIIKFRDNKVPSKLMKMLLRHHRTQQNESVGSSGNNSRLLLPDIGCNKFGLQNKNLPSVYD